MKQEIEQYNNRLSATEKAICDMLAETIHQALPDAENKLWHAHPVWFLEGNPIVGYSKQSKGIKLMFWSGASFEEEQLSIRGSKFKDASVLYTNAAEVDTAALMIWLHKSRDIQWDYKNIVKRKGQLERLK